MWSLFIINTILLLMALFQVYRMVRLLRCQDKIVLLTIVDIFLSLLFTEIFIIAICSQLHGMFTMINESFYFIMVLLNDMFYLLAVSLTLTKW